MCKKIYSTSYESDFVPFLLPSAQDVHWANQGWRMQIDSNLCFSTCFPIDGWFSGIRFSSLSDLHLPFPRIPSYQLFRRKDFLRNIGGIERPSSSSAFKETIAEFNNMLACDPVLWYSSAIMLKEDSPWELSLLTPGLVLIDGAQVWSVVNFPYW